MDGDLSQNAESEQDGTGGMKDVRGVVTAQDAVVGNAIADCLNRSAEPTGARFAPLGSPHLEFGDLDLAVIAPGEASMENYAKRLADLKASLGSVLSHQVKHVVVVSSGGIYGPDHRLTGFVSEESKRRAAFVNRQALWWEDVEKAVRDGLETRPDVRLVVLRLPFVIGGNGESGFDRAAKRRWLFRYVGFNPPLQLVSVSGLARAVRSAFEKKLSGVFHVAPDDVVPLRSMLKARRIRSLGVPRTFQRFLRPFLLRFIDGVRTTDEIDYFRHPWTLSGRKFAEATGLRFSSREALDQTGAIMPDVWPEFDRFGADEAYYRRRGKSIWRFGEKVYFRIETKGFDHLPRGGRAIVVGPHRGFMPLDAVMMCHLIYQHTGRIIRFLIHPSLVKFPILGPFFQKMGGVMACNRNAERVLESDQVLGVYPEGISGAFKMYRDAYKFERFGRPDYARWALEFDVPVVPFAIVGSAEIFPILGKIKSKWLKSFLEWPFVPITPTFPILPLPLPSKWHVRFLPPIHPREIRQKADDLGKDAVAVFTETVRHAVGKATREMLERRKSVFRGRIWNDDPDARDGS